MSFDHIKRIALDALLTVYVLVLVVLSVNPEDRFEGAGE